jgi:hypothetical protein
MEVEHVAAVLRRGIKSIVDPLMVDGWVKACSVWFDVALACGNSLG